MKNNKKSGMIFKPNNYKNKFKIRNSKKKKRLRLFLK